MTQDRVAHSGHPDIVGARRWRDAEMTLTAKLAVAMILPVAIAVSAVGWLSYRSLEQAVLPRVLDRIEAHSRLVAVDLASYVASARGDIAGFRSAAALNGLIRAHLNGVEPFFTSKEPGKGTGLGLSMVYGFVKQSAGHIQIYSEEGHGTTIKIYLPPGTGFLSDSDAAFAPTIQGGDETILVVEDDRLVRDYVLTQLHSLGYVTLQAANGTEALAIVEAGHEFDLLFTDVIMPGAMNGRQLANEVAGRRPGSKVLFTSGYTENAIIHHGRLDSGVMLLVKPYRKSDMAGMIPAALDG
jgi:CheY-like chemotaxis protein